MKDISPTELSAEWTKGRFRPVYYLVGEASARAEAVREIKKRLNPGDFDFSDFFEFSDQTAQTVVSDALTPPLVSERRLVVVTAPRIPAAAKKILADYLKDPLKSTTLVLGSDDRKPDPKDPLVSAARGAGAVAVFHPLRDYEAQKRLIAEAQKAGKTLAREAAEAVIEEAGTDWGILSQELRNILTFAGKREDVSLEMALQCLGFSKAADPFALGRLIQNRDLSGSLRQLKKTFDSGKSSDQAFRALGQIRSAVFKQLHAKRLLKAGQSPDRITSSLRVWDREFIPRLGRMSQARLARDLGRCLRTETDLKSKAWLDPKLELEGLIVDLCRSGVSPMPRKTFS